MDIEYIRGDQLTVGRVLVMDNVQYRIVDLIWWAEMEMWIIDTRFTQWNNQAVFLAYNNTSCPVLVQP